jgi:hypothetical protein
VNPEAYYSVSISFSISFILRFPKHKIITTKKHAKRPEDLKIVSRALDQALLDHDEDTTFLRNVIDDLVIDIV